MTWYETLGIVAGSVAAVGVIWKSPIGTGVRWLLRRNVAEPLKAASRSVIHDTVGPLVADVKANAKAQHDEQNDKLGKIETRLVDHSRRLSQIEEFVTAPKENR